MLEFGGKSDEEGYEGFYLDKKDKKKAKQIEKQKTKKFKTKKRNKFLDKFNEARNYKKDRTNRNQPGKLDIREKDYRRLGPGVGPTGRHPKDFKGERQLGKGPTKRVRRGKNEEEE